MRAVKCMATCYYRSMGGMYFDLLGLHAGHADATSFMLAV